MGYRNYRYRHAWNNPESKKTALERRFGGAANEITRAFYALDMRSIDALMRDYGKIYGKQAEDYARRTMPKWRSGTVNLSGQTLERLIQLVPPFLTPQKRLEILELILKRYERSPKTQRIEINVKKPDEGLAQIDNALRNIGVTDEMAYLPAGVMDTAKWLYADDVTTARAMLSKLSAAETRALKESAVREIELLKRTINSGQVKNANYTVNTPGGNLVISASTPSFCFVATVCFGNTDPRTNTLRKWRDETLRHSPVGRRFIIWYYGNGPRLAQVIGSSYASLLLTRATLTFFVVVLRSAIKLRQKSRWRNHV